MKKSQYGLLLLLVQFSFPICVPNLYAQDDLLFEMMRNQRDPNRELRESTDYFNQSMEKFSATLNKKILEAAMNDLSEMIMTKGAANVTTNDVIDISQNRRLKIDQTRELFYFLKMVREMDTPK